METRIWISKIEFNDRQKIKFDESDITVFVGPNNAGKSASLKEIANLLNRKNDKNIVVKDINIEKEGDEASLLTFIQSHSKKHFIGGNPEPNYLYCGIDIYAGSIRNHWENYKNGLSELFAMFVIIINTEKRLNAADPAHNIRLTSDQPTHPIHFLQKSDELEKRFSGYFCQAFGKDLIVHRNAGNEVPLYVGKRPILKDDEDRISESYLDKIEKLDKLQLQGDGMRSFAGVLLDAFISNYSILLIDEPEAFLHPPHARLMGKMLARDLPPGRQLFLATHSEDFLKGLLDASKNNLNIIRIQRDGDINRVKVLTSTDIKEIWNDPILRHSNVLDGLFHSKVILCESDSDCRFYSAILSAVNDGTGSISPDVLFMHCGGKDRMPIVIKSLKNLDVDIRVIADFDVLNGTYPLRKIFEELGGTWTTIENDFNIVRKSIDGKKAELETKELEKEIIAILGSCGRIVPEKEASAIRAAVGKASPWANAKDGGKTFVPSGDATQAYERVQIQLRENGLHIVEVGELEGFCKSIGGHGPKWVNDVMANKNLKDDTELEPSRKFIQDVIS